MNSSGDDDRSAFERFYLPAVLSVWVLAPGLRRLIDWQFGATKLSIISVLPLLALLPLVFIVFRSAAMQRYGLRFKSLVFFWMFGFLYALVVSFVARNYAGGIYDFAEFCLPLLLGAWVVMRRASRQETFNSLTSTLLWLGTFESVYAIYQYVAPPPWDVDYVNNANQITLGVPEPFGLHPFSTINSPGALSVFLAVVILLNFHKLKLSRPLPLLALTVSIAALILTNVRSSWLALAVGILAYLVLSPKRAQAITSLGAIAIITLLFISNASTLLGNTDVSSQLQSRVSSLTGVDDDASLNARREEANAALHQALEEPLGGGLGTVGTSAKLGGTLLDNGYLSRYLEMGIAGLIAYLATLGLGVILSFAALMRSVANRDATLQLIAVYGLSIQAALIGLDFSSDFHSSLPGVFWWILLGLCVRREPGDEKKPAILESISSTQSPGRTRPVWI